MLPGPPAFPYLAAKQRKMKNRRAIQGEVHHVYQRTIGGAVIFYDIADYLVFFTIVCTVAERLGMTVLALCPMPDHLHQVCRIRSKQELSGYVQQYTHLFAQEWNRSRGRKGPLFRARFGCAAKLGNKSIRNTLAYNNNNPVERKMAVRAEDYRWNFLQYGLGNHPYSKPLSWESASRKLRKVLKEVQRRHRNGEWVHYGQWDRWTRGLRPEEIQQLADYVIETWNVIDFRQAAAYYGNGEAMLRAFHDNTGSEYEIVEDKDKYSDAVYADCTRVLLQQNKIRRVREIPLLPVEEKMALAHLLLQRTAATLKQVRRYLHWRP